MITRRRLIGGLALAGAGGVLGAGARPAGAEPPPETATIRLVQTPSLCLASQYVAEDLLRSEGFHEVRYVQSAAGVDRQLVSGEADVSQSFAGPVILRVDAGDPLLVLAGAHTGCIELVAREGIKSVGDLKGKAVSVHALGSPTHVLLAAMAAYVGLDPARDIRWVLKPVREAVDLLTAGKIDALVAFPPITQELRDRKVGYVLVNTTTDRPWSQYFCCMIVANRDFVHRYPVATKRALRALLKAVDLCGLEPERVARTVAGKRYPTSYEYALQTMRELPYGRWREYNPEDTVRFLALRLQEVEMIRSTPQTIIARGTDWRFHNELKKELKG